MGAPKRRRALVLRWVAAALAGLLGCGVVLAQEHAASSAVGALQALQAEVDLQVQRGLEQPDDALAALAKIEALSGQPRLLNLGRGLVAASVARTADVTAALATLRRLGDDPLLAADAALIRAALADAQGNTTDALKSAQVALQGYQRACVARTDCDYRSTWRAQMLLARHDLRRGLNSTALEHALAAAERARKAGDAPRHALALAVAADLSGLQGDSAGEQSHLAQALRIAGLDGTPLLRSRVRLFEAKILRRSGNNEGARRAAIDGLALARRASSQRTAAQHLVNLSDTLVALGDARGALQAVEQALPLAPGLGDRRAERALKHNAALARIGLGQTVAARGALNELLAAYRGSGASADEAAALREFADAFAAAGELPTALKLFHRERELAAQMMAANRDAALAELRQRFDREAQQERLNQLGRESRLMSSQLDNRAAMQKVWLAGAAALALAAVLVALMYRRVRALNRRLEHNHAYLRAQSHRDPLTGLTNRRGLHEAAAARGHHLRFEGVLLLVDIDHFKRVNDGHGHAAGDVVLVEVARRLAEVVRGDDLVVRWGGEEFLLCVPGGDAGHAKALAQRVLQAVGAAPVALPGQPAGALHVTVSVGYGCFPLPPTQLPLAMERAINLADMALYTAKNQGRNCAVGIEQTQADDAASLHALEADFDQARQEGRVTLGHLAGPPPASNTAQTELELQPG